MRESAQFWEEASAPLTIKWAVANVAPVGWTNLAGEGSRLNGPSDGFCHDQTIVFSKFPSF